MRSKAGRYVHMYVCSMYLGTYVGIVKFLSREVCESFGENRKVRRRPDCCARGIQAIIQVRHAILAHPLKESVPLH